jgi:hypothetical protein
MQLEYAKQVRLLGRRASWYNYSGYSASLSVLFSLFLVTMPPHANKPARAARLADLDWGKFLGRN